MLKCADNEDIITMKADDAGDVVTFMFESPGTSPIASRTSRATRDPEPGRRSRTVSRRVFQTPPLEARFRVSRRAPKLAHRKTTSNETRPVSLAPRTRVADRLGTHPLTPARLDATIASASPLPSPSTMRRPGQDLRFRAEADGHRLRAPRHPRHRVRGDG